jgi:SAM-dependent methyltransferase
VSREPLVAHRDRESMRFVEEAYWMVLGRSPTPAELGAERHGLDLSARRALLLRLMASVEFDDLLGALRQEPAAADGRVESGLAALGDSDTFVRRAYECLLGRPADDSGFGHYTRALASGDSRRSIVRSLLLSEEFERRYRCQIVPQGGVVPRDVQLCELANPAKWDNPEWLAILADLGLSTDKRLMHRKPYEFAQLVFGCRRLGAIRPDAAVVSVGAGHEHVAFWLANHVRRVVATDLYGGVWREAPGREGDPSVIDRPTDYAPFPYRRDHLTFMKMDGRRLAFSDRTFNLAYSLSSIEHFGGVAGAVATVKEMTRVLKPGGVLALATEYVLHGPPHEETFQPHEIAALIEASGLELVEPIDERVYDRYEHAAIDLHANPYQAPHMVVRFDDTVFTTVMLFLRKG